MLIHVACPQCHKEYHLSPQVAGTEVRCQACQAVISVPVAVDGLEPAEAPLLTALPAPVQRRRQRDEFWDEERPAPAPSTGKTLLFLFLGGGALVFVLSVLVAIFAFAGSTLLTAGLQHQPNNPTSTATSPPPPNDVQPPPGNPNPKPPVDNGAKLPINKKPKQPKIDPEEEIEDKVSGPPLEPDPLLDPLPPPVDARATLPLPDTRNDPTRFPWCQSPVVAVAARSKGQDAWQVWNIQSKKLLGTVPGGWGERVMLSADGKYLAMPVKGSGIKYSTVSVYTVADGKLLRDMRVLAYSDSRIGMVEFAGPDQLMAVEPVGLDADVKLWDVRTGEKILKFRIDGSANPQALALSPGCRYLASYDSMKRVLLIYELATGKLLRKTKVNVSASSWFNTRGVAFSNDGKKIAMLFEGEGIKNVLQCWDFATGKRVANFKFDEPLTKSLLNAAWYPTPLAWLPDDSAWLVYGQLFIDPQRGNIFFKMLANNPSGATWLRRFVDADHFVTVVEGAGKTRQVEVVPLPREEMEAARKK